MGSERIKSKTEKRGGLVGENRKEERGELKQKSGRSQDDDVLNFR